MTTTTARAERASQVAVHARTTAQTERVGEFIWLVDGGESIEMAAHRLGWTVRGLVHALRRDGRRPDLQRRAMSTYNLIARKRTA